MPYLVIDKEDAKNIKIFPIRDVIIVMLILVIMFLIFELHQTINMYENSTNECMRLNNHTQKLTELQKESLDSLKKFFQIKEDNLNAPK